MLCRSDSKFIRREFYRKRMTKIESGRYDATSNVKDQVVISVDCSSAKRIVEVNDLKVQHLEDVVSQQFILGYNGTVMYYVLTRNQNDAPL